MGVWTRIGNDKAKELAKQGAIHTLKCETVMILELFLPSPNVG